MKGEIIFIYTMQGKHVKNDLNACVKTLCKKSTIRNKNDESQIDELN